MLSVYKSNRCQSDVKMRIRSFCKYIEKDLEPFVLNDCTVVVDGHNFFYGSYQLSGLTHEFGCESDRYADYIRDRLSMFKKAKIKCYFLFKGGHENMPQRLKKHKEEAIVPIFMKNIYKEVLKEMEFEYVVCQYESKKDIVALAYKVNCPIVSFDVEYCFSGARYIPTSELKFVERDNTITSRYFQLDSFMQKYYLTKKKIAIFIVLTDSNLYHGITFFDLFDHLKIPLTYYYTRNEQLLGWLSKNSSEQCLRTIFRFISVDDKVVFEKELAKIQLMMERLGPGGLAVESLLKHDAAQVARGDPDWFPKGVVGNYIPIDYINLYRSKCFFGSHAIIPLPSQDDAMTLSLHIVKYAYDLLTNFQNEGFTFVYDTKLDRETTTVGDAYSIRKPNYEANICVFENGWSELREIGLFEHFLTVTLPGVKLQILEKVPEDARLFIIALVYFSRKKSADVSVEVACMLLNYVTLSVVFDRMNKKNLPSLPLLPKPILESLTDKTKVTVEDCNSAAVVLADYHKLSKSDVEDILDREMLHPLVEFQQCLSQLNDLNTLCGGAYAPVLFSRAYNGALVYQLVHAARAADDLNNFLDGLLSPAPTVYAFFKGLIEAYEDVCNLS